MRYECVFLSVGAAVLALHAQQDPANREPVWQNTIQKANKAQANGRFAEAEPLIQTAWTEVERGGAADERFPAGVQEVVKLLRWNRAGLQRRANPACRRDSGGQILVGAPQSPLDSYLKGSDV
jgi:hypothetical protein